MPNRLYLHGRQIASIFELLGRKENDLTFSLGWALSQSPVLRRQLFQYVLDVNCPDDVQVKLQERVKGGGITDIELLTVHDHIVIEAKRGWNVPSEDQFRKYAPRLRKANRDRRAMVAMTEASNTVAEMELPRSVAGAPVKHVSWRHVQRWASKREGSHAEKRLLAQLREYLERVVKMQNQSSNEVYVVSLGGGKPSWSRLTWIEIVEDKGYYFHVLGRSGWPTEPPNYLGFRYRGRLQSIHHVEECRVVLDCKKEMPEVTPDWKEKHFLYKLGPAIKPRGDVKSGKVYPSGRVWADIDLLLTSKTISDARDKSQDRRKLAESADPD